MQRQEEAQIFTAIRHFGNSKSTVEIVDLIEKGADLTVVNMDNETPIQLAKNLEYWDCVEDIAQTKKSDKDDDKACYGSALLSAVKRDRYETAKILLEAGAAQTRYYADDKNRCLHWAIKNKNNQMLKLLIKHAHDLTKKNDMNDKQYTPIQLAASLGYWDGVNIIVQAKNTDIKDEARYGSALRMAVRANQLMSVKLLIKAKAPLAWYTNKTGNYCLHEAVRLNNPHLVQVLLEAGANQLAVNNDGLTPLEFACSLDCWASADEFIRDEKFTFDNEERAGLALIQAIKAGQLRLASYLIEANASLEAQTKEDRYTALHVAVSANSVKSIQLLLDKRASQIALTKSDETPIELGARLGHWDSVQCLLEFTNAEKDEFFHRAKHYESALLYAIKAGNYSIVKLLLEHHAPCNQWNSTVGNIALYEAVNINRVDIVALLVDAGADVNRLNAAGKRICDFARERKYDECAQFLHKKTNQTAASIVTVEPNEVDILFCKLIENEIAPRKLPKTLEKFFQLSATQLENDLKKMRSMRDLFQNLGVQTLDAAVLSYSGTEMDMLTNLIRVANSLLNYPDNPASPYDIAVITQMQYQGSIEADHVVTHINRHAYVDAYINRIKQWLIAEKKYLSENTWYVKGVFVEWTKGRPTHIGELIDLLVHINPLSDKTSVLTAYTAFCDKLWSINTSTKRHPETVSYYLTKAMEIKSFAFTLPVIINAEYATDAHTYQVPQNYNYPTVVNHYWPSYEAMQNYQVTNNLTGYTEQASSFEPSVASVSNILPSSYQPNDNQFIPYASSESLYPVLTGYDQNALPIYASIAPHFPITQHIQEQQPVLEAKYERVQPEVKQVDDAVAVNSVTEQVTTTADATFEALMAQAPSVRNDSFRLFSHPSSESSGQSLLQPDVREHEEQKVKTPSLI